ncbi:cytochrome P450 71D9-like [Pistacia vera]|uniref:cytochrome P450 71D9-like n=1 Tax=Pistacia vera TaxID=55513 RepID=UPI0012636B9F|nr:cytochrome P450 71D9-like [Pistacia vera]XP_031280672.1 cytochrome P450 71D9-like [Pistacia vera]
MELVFPSFPILLIFLLFLFMLLKIMKRSQTNDGTSNLPPGPWKLPLIGNLHQLVSAESLSHYRLRDLAKKYGPLMHLQLGEISVVVVSSPEFAEQVMKTHDAKFASRPHNEIVRIASYNYSDVAFSPCGDYWRKLRNLYRLELLSPKQVQSFRSLREEEMSSLVNSIASKSGSVINLTDNFFTSTYGITARAAFGGKCKDNQVLIPVATETIRLMAGFYIADMFPSIKFLQSISGTRSKLERLHKELDRILENIINEHKKSDKMEENKDLVDILLELQGRDDLQFCLTTEGIKATIFDIFVGGSDTVATTMDWAMSELIKNPGLMKRVQDEVREVFNRKGKVDETGINEMKFLKLVIKETLRLHPAGPFLLPRESIERCEIKSFNVPAKTRVLVNAWAIARDPKYWSEPEIFKPERFLDLDIEYTGTNFKFIPFGAGRRMCPGTSYALASVEIALAMLLYHFDWKLPNGMKHEDLDMTEAFGLTARRKDDLCLIPIPYHP